MEGKRGRRDASNYWCRATVFTVHFHPKTKTFIIAPFIITTAVLSPWIPQILPTKMSYSANLKNVMSMETSQRGREDQPMDQELVAPKPGPSPHDLAAQLKSSLLAEIGLTESDGPPLPSFRYGTRG